MLIWNRWSDFWVLLAILIFSFGGQISYAASNPEAIKCVEDFIARYKNASGYRTIFKKREWDLEGKQLHDEMIELTFSKPKRTLVKYINEGATGIRNSGMTVEYKEGDQVEVKLGKPNVLGFLFNSIATFAIPDKLSLFDSKVIEDEIFTINRAGINHLAFALEKQLESLKANPIGGLALGKGSCELKYTPHSDKIEQLEVAPTDSIFDLEEKYATLAYVIYQYNRGALESFRDLFVRERKMTLKIPRSFMEFDLTLHPVSKLPTQFNIRQNGKVIGAYEFLETELN